MIKDIHICSEASYSPEGAKLSGLAKVNYIYGANGSGKTTISRVIGDPDKYTNCKISYKESGCRTLVYNKEFVDTYFKPELKGIYTLGEENKEIADALILENEKRKTINSEITILTRKLKGEDGNGGREKDISDLEEKYEDIFWKYKTKHYAAFKEPLKGAVSSKKTFKERLLKECVQNTSELLTEEVLREKIETVFLLEQTIISQAPIYSASNIMTYETAAILQKKIVGKEDVDIGAMIEKLGNSDWVQAGRQYYNTHDKVCPFCQQETKEGFSKKLEEYFDETYLNDISAIKALAANYVSHSDTFENYLGGIISADNRYTETLLLKQELINFQAVSTANKQLLDKKIKEPSTVITLEPSCKIVSRVQDIIVASNKKIDAYNSTILNIPVEKERLIAQVWRFIADKAAQDYGSYSALYAPLFSEISGIQTRLQNKQTELDAANKKIAELTRNVTSIDSTINGINGILTTFGFLGFSLKKAEKVGYYKIVRGDGRVAGDTLSEGEKSFIVFLYFYHLATQGSLSADDTESDRIIVIDDPVSSLDCEVLFIVSTLTRRIANTVWENSHKIKQLIVLTHNIYFYKEVGFTRRGDREASRDKLFWVLKKQDGITKIDRHKTNPIKSSYELLWDDVRGSGSTPHATQNSMRRILEFYFTTLGGLKLDDAIGSLDGNELLAGKALLSWINDGSHSVYDELHVTTSFYPVEVYQSAFKRIFDALGHLDHYKMMMKIEENEISSNDDTNQKSEEAA